MPQKGSVDEHATRQALWIFALVAAATFAITRLAVHPTAGEYVHLAIAMLFITISVRLARGNLRHFGLQLGGLLEPAENDQRHPGPLGLFDLARAAAAASPLALREAGVALLTALVLFPPFAAGFSWWHGTSQPFELALPDSPLSFVTAQLLLVALPEEAFFRGYLQTRLQNGEAKRVTMLGATFGPRSMILQAALFASVHFLVDPNPARLAVFFPALVFGWLRARRGGIGAAVFFHAACNIYSVILSQGWL